METDPAPDASDARVHLALRLPARVGGKLRLGRTLCGLNSGFWRRFTEAAAEVTCRKCLGKLREAASTRESQ